LGKANPLLAKRDAKIVNKGESIGAGLPVGLGFRSLAALTLYPD
jgi:hypothetical protein